jgi:hypothetical protein
MTQARLKATGAPFIVIAAKGRPGFDLKLRRLGAAGFWGLTAWTSRGRRFLEDHVVTLDGAIADGDCVWFPERHAPIAAFARSGLRLVAGTGGSSDPKNDSLDPWTPGAQACAAATGRGLPLGSAAMRVGRSR